MSRPRGWGQAIGPLVNAIGGDNIRWVLRIAIGVMLGVLGAWSTVFWWTRD